MSWLVVILIAITGLFIASMATGVLLRHLLVPGIWGIFHGVRLVGQVIIELVRDLLAAAWHLVVAVLQLPIILGMLVFGKWQRARDLTRAIGLRFRRVGRRVSGLVTKTAPVASGIRATPSRRQMPRGGSKEFPGWTIVGELKPGGSGAQLHIAEPAMGAPTDAPPKVVIKCFDLSSGSPLGQMIRESRALDGAKQLGLVIEHNHDEHRFWYVMPYIPGTHLGEAIQSMQAAGPLPAPRDLQQMLGWQRDLLATLREYHDAGLWHKDIKPENIIINDTGAHLVDLGLVTPLRSAMTLTTHGTEYFRDPELVRQAVRGAKVADVDGARFDVYSAGAVLYYMLEGTFPAHGNLSRFQRSSGDAIRWVIRRAMADYNQRYEMIDSMLADVNFLANAASPADVRPADLPSFSGQQPDDASEVQSPKSSDRVAVQRRPRLEVSDWWSGAYRVLDAVPGVVHRLDDAFSAAQRARRDRRSARQEARARRRAARRASLGGAVAFLVGCVALVLVYVVVSEITESGGDAHVSMAVESLPRGTGRVLVLNDHPTWTGGGADLVDRLIVAGWSPKIDGAAEAGFRRAMPTSGVDAHDFQDSARAALRALDLDAAAIIRSLGPDGGVIEVVVVTDDGVTTCRPFGGNGAQGDVQSSP